MANEIEPIQVEGRPSASSPIARSRAAAPYPAISRWLVIAAVFLTASANAQNFSGTYQGNSQAGTVTLTLELSGEDLAGTLSASGVEFVLEGFLQNGVGVGLAYTAEGSVGFEAYLEGTTLGLYLFEMDAAGAPIVESVIELLLTKQVGAAAGSRPGSVLGVFGGQPAPTNQPRTNPAPATPLAGGGPVIATGAFGSLSEDNALAFIEALEFVLAQVGYAYTFTDADRIEALRALATNYPSMAQMDQVVLAQARDIWQRVQANWSLSSPAEQREFALGVLVLAFGEQTVSSWVGSSGGGGQSLGGGSSCTTFEDCTSSFVDEQTWSDTFNAQGCWAAAGCGGFDPSSNSFNYDTY